MSPVEHLFSSSASDEKEMLNSLGFNTIDELLDKLLPPEIRTKTAIKLPPPLNEIELTKQMFELSNRNADCWRYTIYLGGGIYDHFVPAVVDDIISKPEFYTAYTPYQAEASQGTLQAIFEFQSLIARLTGMDVANASMYDGASSTAEALRLACEYTSRKKILSASTLNPLYKDVIKTYLNPFKVELLNIGSVDGRLEINELEDKLCDDIAAVVIQNPNFFGVIEDPVGLSDMVHNVGALLVVVVDPVSLGLLIPPGEYGADIVTGEGQSLGWHMNFGGPGLGIFATKKEFVRLMPGRIVGETTDIEGKKGYVHVLQTREQHIRREKATSNICTNSALVAVAAAVYLSLLGENGLRKLARICFDRAHYLAENLSKIDGVRIRFGSPFFKEFVVDLPIKAKSLVSSLLEKKIIAGIPLSHFFHNMESSLLVAVTEKRTKEELDYFVDNVKSIIHL